jgi:hypothetical protein
MSNWSNRDILLRGEERRRIEKRLRDRQGLLTRRHRLDYNQQGWVGCFLNVFLYSY